MAGDGISIPITASVDQFSAAIKAGVISPLDNVQEAMDKITAASNSAGGNGLAEGMVAAQKATESESESLDKIKGNLSEYQAASRTAAVAVKSDTEGTTEAFEVSGTEQKRIAKETTEDVAKSSKALSANLGQGLAGLSGSIGDLSQTATSALGQVAFLATDPEIAIAAGVGAAAVGLLTSAFNGSATASQAAITEAQAFVKTALGTGSGVDAVDTIIRKWASDTGNMGISLKDLNSASKTAQVNFGSLANAIAGQNVPAMKKMLDANEAQAASLTKQSEALAASKTASQGKTVADAAQAAALEKIDGVLEQNVEANKLEAETIASAAQAMHLSVPEYEAYEKAVDAAKTGTSDLASTVKSSMSDAATDTSDWASSTKVNLTQISTNLAEAQALWERIPQDVQTLTKAGLTNAGLEYIESLPNGEQIIDAMAVNPGQWATLIAQFNTQGTQGASAYTRAINGAMPKTIPGPRVVVGAPDLSAVIAGIKTVTGQTYTLKFQGVNTNGVRVP